MALHIRAGLTRHVLPRRARRPWAALEALLGADYGFGVLLLCSPSRERRVTTERWPPFALPRASSAIQQLGMYPLRLILGADTFCLSRIVSCQELIRQFSAGRGERPNTGKSKEDFARPNPIQALSLLPHTVSPTEQRSAYDSAQQLIGTLASVPSLGQTCLLAITVCDFSHVCREQSNGPVRHAPVRLDSIAYRQR